MKLIEIVLSKLEEGDCGVFKRNHWNQFQHFYVKVVTNKYVIIEKSFDSDFSGSGEYCIRKGLDNDDVYTFRTYKEVEDFSEMYRKSGKGYTLKESYAIMGYVKPKQTVSHKYFSIYPSGLVVIYRDYFWNGANAIPDTKSNLRASCLHDVYCQAMELKLLSHYFRQNSDMSYRDICVEDGMNPYIADIQYKFLRIYGKVRYGH